MQGLKTGPEGCWIPGRESFLKHGNNAFEREWRPQMAQWWDSAGEDRGWIGFRSGETPGCV